MISLIDTHCHIDLEAFDADRAEMLARMLGASVHGAILIAYNPERWITTERLCADHAFLQRVVGVHPNDASLWSDAVRDGLCAELAKGDALGVGEIGLDYFREHAAPEQQRVAFTAQIAIARDLDLPIVIHQRSAEQDVLDTLRRFAPVRGVMHCFSGASAFADACLELGLYLGVGGVITHPKSVDIREALRTSPLDRFVLETDAPFLAPQLVRGKRNEPAHVAEIAVRLAELQGHSIVKIADITSANAIHLFGGRLEAARIAGMKLAACA